MQLLPCPFCGPRPEDEFFYGGDAGKVRPEPAPGQPVDSVEAEIWAAYLWTQDNRRGPTRELWRHGPCRQWFVMRRDTLTHQVMAAEPLPIPDAAE